MDNVLNEEEMLKLLIQLGKGQETFTEEDADIVEKWAIQAKIDKYLFDSVLEGEVVLSIRNGELRFGLAKNDN